MTHDCSCGGHSPAAKPNLEPERQMAKSTFKDNIFKGLFQAAEPDAVRQIALDAAIIKALEVGSDGQESGDLFDSDRVIDQSIGAAGTRRLTSEEIKVGRPQSASGQGASRMIAEFSSPDSQQDIVENYQNLSAQLGELKTAMKSMSEAFSAALVAAKADDDKKDDDDEMCKSEALSKADEIEDEDDDDDKPFGKSEVVLSGPAKAASTYIQAAEELDVRAKAARKSKDMDRARTLKSKVEKTLTKALSLLAVAPDKGTPAVKGIIGDIHAAALVKGFTELAALAAKAESDAAGTEVAAKAQEHEHMQDEWPSGHGPQSSKAESPAGNVANKAELEAKLDAVLKGYQLQEGTLATMMEAVMGKSAGRELKTIDLGLAAKSDLGAKDPTALFKSNGDAWEALKMDQIAAAIDSGEFRFADEMACQSILSTASAVRQGAIPGELLKSRVNASSEAIRNMFAEVLA